MKAAANRDAYVRMNFLYQAAHTTLTQNPDNTQLARFYISTLNKVAKRLVLRIHPHMKRTICKRCDLLLIPGITATVRIRARREQHTVLTCLECKEVKRFLCREEYKLWVEQPESRQQPENYRKGKKKQGKNQQGKKKTPTKPKTTHQQPSGSGETKPATDT